MAQQADLMDLERVDPTRAPQEIWDVVDRDGGVVIEALVSRDIVDAVNAEIDEPLRELAPGAKDPEFNVFFGANTKRLTNMIGLSPTFRETILQHPAILGLGDHVMTRLSDSYWLTATQVIEVGPGSVGQMLHRDMSNYPVFVPQGPDGPEVVMNIIVALTEFREETGATRVLPGSNRWPDYTDIDEERDRPRTIAVEMQPGDALLISGKVIHGAGANVTSDQYRRGMAVAFSPGFLVPEQAFPFEVPLELVRTLPPRIQQLIGFRSFHNHTNYGGSLWQHDYAELADHLQLQ